MAKVEDDGRGWLLQESEQENQRRPMGFEDAKQLRKSHFLKCDADALRREHEKECEATNHSDESIEQILKDGDQYMRNKRIRPTDTQKKNTDLYREQYRKRKSKKALKVWLLLIGLTILICSVSVLPLFLWEHGVPDGEVMIKYVIPCVFIGSITMEIGGAIKDSRK